MVDPFYFSLHTHNFYPNFEKETDNHEQSINTYSFYLYPADKSFLFSSYKKSNQIQRLNSENLSLLPMAVRYAEIDKNFYVIERPPFQIDVDYYPNKKINAKLAAHIPGKKMWIPWTVFIVSLGQNVNSLIATMYFNDKPLESFDDLLVRAYTPNIFNDGRVCFGNSLHTFTQRIERGDIEYNITNVYNYLFNDYFTQWNPDLTLNHVLFYHNYFSENGFFDRILSVKKHPKGIENYRNWNYVRAWPYFLYCLSTMSYQETMDFVSYLKDENCESFSNVVDVYNTEKYPFRYLNADEYPSVLPVGNALTYYDYFKSSTYPLVRETIQQLKINCSFIDFPKDALLKAFRSEETASFIYSYVFDSFNQTIEYIKTNYSSLYTSNITLEDIYFKSDKYTQNQFCDLRLHFNHKLHEFFSYGSVHVAINYEDYSRKLLENSYV